MGKKEDDKDNLFCSFCGKNQKEVTKLIAGPAVYICDECIQLCSEIIEEESEKESTEVSNLLAPKEIKSRLDEYVIEQERAKKVHPISTSFFSALYPLYLDEPMTLLFFESITISDPPDSRDSRKNFSKIFLS